LRGRRRPARRYGPRAAPDIRARSSRLRARARTNGDEPAFRARPPPTSGLACGSAQHRDGPRLPADLFRAAARGLPDIIVAVDRHGVISFYNDGARARRWGMRSRTCSAST
jgi:hypothetical protein